MVPRGSLSRRLVVGRSMRLVCLGILVLFSAIILLLATCYLLLATCYLLLANLHWLTWERRLPRTNMPCPLLARGVVYGMLDRSQEAAQIAIGEGERPLPFIVIVQLGHVLWPQNPIESRRIERPKNGEEIAVSLVHGGLAKRRYRALNPLHVAVADLVA